MSHPDQVVGRRDPREEPPRTMGPAAAARARGEAEAHVAPGRLRATRLLERLRQRRARMSKTRARKRKGMCRFVPRCAMLCKIETDLSEGEVHERLQDFSMRSPGARRPECPRDWKPRAPVADPVSDAWLL